MKSGRLLVVLAVTLAIGVVVVYVLAGGRSYQPRPVADPCSPPTEPTATERVELASELALDGVQRAACTLGVSRERLTLALLSPEAIAALEQDQQVPPGTVERAVRPAADQALTDASDSGILSPLELAALREAVDTVPLNQVIEVLRGTSDPCSPTPWRTTASTRRVADQVALRAFFRASCDLGVAPSELALALTSGAELDKFKRSQGLSDAAFDDATRGALRGAVTDAEEAGALTGVTAVALRFAIDKAPIATLISMLQGGGLSQG